MYHGKLYFTMFIGAISHGVLSTFVIHEEAHFLLYNGFLNFPLGLRPFTRCVVQSIGVHVCHTSDTLATVGIN